MMNFLLHHVFHLFPSSLSLSPSYSISPSLLLSIFLHHLYFLLAYFHMPRKANNQTGMNKNTMLPHVMFLIKLVFETEIHLSFIHFILSYKSKLPSKQSKTSQSNNSNFFFFFLSIKPHLGLSSFKASQIFNFCTVLYSYPKIPSTINLSLL
jgi:hypothetical protein